jgi:uncharacterized protein RhaS with RHS repeats
VGRWLTKDPIGFAGGDTNLYRYASNDPVNFVDMSGEWAWLVASAGIGAAVNLAMTYTANWGCSLTKQQIAAALASGAISGFFGGIAGPAGGSLARLISSGARGASAGLLANSLRVTISAAGGAAGQSAANSIDPDNASNILNAGFWAGIGGTAAVNLPAVRGMYTLGQARYFGPRRFGSLLRTSNARVLTGGFLVSAATGGAANFIQRPFPSNTHTDSSCGCQN